MSEMNKMNQEVKVGELFQNIFKKNWNEEFIFDGINSVTLSYEEFFSKVLRYKEKLEKTGLKKQDVICLLLPNSTELIILYFAVLLMNLKVVPIDPERGSAEIREILSRLDYKVIISNEQNFDFTQKNILVNEFTNIKSEIIEKEELDLFNNVNFNEIYLITFTSGSTGIPKGVMHSFNNLVKSAIAFNDKFSFDSKNIFYHNLPMTYMAGILNLLILPIIAESKIIVGKRFNISNISEFWNIPIQYSANTFWFIPTILEILLKLDRDPKGLQYTKSNKIVGCVGTSPLNPSTKDEFEKKYSLSLYESYGLSETLFVTTNFPNFDKSGSVGKALDDVETNFLEDGEIAIKVPWMFLGYHSMKENQLLNGWFSSGDIGHLDANKFFIITGRKKELIIKGGINISPKKIEDFIKNYYNIEVVVLGFVNKFMGEKTVCFLVPNGELDQKHINKKITEELGKSYHIDQFVELEKIPRNLNGKVDKPKIREIYKLN